jgi:C4-type Zn-finger protein
MEKKIKCPCCAGGLYAAGVLHDSPRVLGISADSPHIESDENGFFMQCPHCSSRIKFDKVPSQVGGVGFRMSDIQKCADCI